MKRITMTQLSIVFLLIVGVFLLSIVQMNKENKMTTNSNNSVSNKKVGWGIKRADNHDQPDCGTENRKILEANNGICLGNREKKYIYLTFDNGYEAGYTGKILDALKQNDVKACFFITAHYANSASDFVKQMIDEGHIIGNHTVNHKSMPDIENEKIKSEIMDLHASIYEKYGYEMKYMRPPKGEFSERTLQFTKTLGYKTVMWSFAYEDWDENKQPDEGKAKSKILNNIHNGEIMLLHGNSKTNADILDSVIKEAKKMGYEFKSLDEFEN